MSADEDIPDREQRVAELLRTAAESQRAPATLHAVVGELRDRSAAIPRRRVLPLPALGLARLALPLAAAVAAALVLTLGGGAAAPSIAQAAALATRPPAGPAPLPDPRDPAHELAAKVGGLHFPNWSSQAGWSAYGQRSDHVGDRTAMTVYYTSGGRRIAYSIVSTPALAGLHTSGEPYATIWRYGRTTVVWEQDGHTCLLSGTGISAPRLWQLATYGFRVPLG